MRIVNRIYLLLLFCLVVFSSCSVPEPGQIYYNVSYESSAGGTIVGTCTQTVSDGEYSQKVEAKPDEGYIFSGWSDGLKTTRRQDKVDGKDLTFTAYFIKCNTYVLRYLCGEGGSIAGSTEQVVSENENGVLVRALPYIGYRFSGWSDGLMTSERREIKVVSDLTVTATFEKISYVTLTYTAEKGGTITGKSPQKIEQGKSGTKVVATPDPGYEFIGWSDGVTLAERTDEQVDKSISVTAYFRQRVYTAEYLVSGNGSVVGETRQMLLYGETTTSVTAVAGEDYEFVCWSDGVKTPTRQDTLTDDLRVSAIFNTLPMYTVEYVEYYGLNYYGYVDGETVQTVKKGGSTKEVTARSKDDGWDWIFLCWDDGVTTPTRKDENIRMSQTFRAIFINAARVNFFVDGGGGSIEGATTQTILNGESGYKSHERDLLQKLGIDDSDLLEETTRVKAVPADGYVFVGWSDGVFDVERSGEAFEYSFKIAAYFEPEQKQFRYDYMGGVSGAMVSSVSVSRESYLSMEYVIPSREGYRFAGWYADKDFTTMVVNPEGRLMFGRFIMNLQTDTLYARWIANDDDTVRYKILIVLMDKVQDNLTILYKDKPIYKYVDIQMTVGEMYLLSQTAWRLADILNDWMKGIVTFDIDTYILNDTLREKDFNGGGTPSVRDFQEIKGLSDSYGSVIGIKNLHDYDRSFTNNYAGTAGKKFAYIDFDRFQNEQTIHILRKEAITYFLYNDRANNEDILQRSLWTEFLDSAIHEFIHTVELEIDPSGEIFHGSLFEYVKKENDGTVKATYTLYRQFLLNQAYWNGEIVGIPLEYWKEVNAV